MASIFSRCQKPTFL